MRILRLFTFLTAAILDSSLARASQKEGPNITVHCTSDATFNHDYLQLCGDVSPNPGPTAAGESSNPRCNAARPNRISKLSCLSLNARSIVNKERELRSCLSINDYDLIAITETWLDPTINSSEIFPTSFEVFRKDRSRNGGGVL